MLKHFSSVIRFIFSRVKIVNPTNAAMEDMVKEIGKEFREELEEIKQLKKS